jgi:Replication-relaxation
VVPLAQRTSSDRCSARRLPGLSIPDLEHRRAAAGFFLALIERSLTRPGEGLYSWLGEQQAQQGTGHSVRPDGYGRYLLPDGEIAFYLEVDRGSESAHRIKGKLDSYRQALAADPHRDRGNILLVCEGQRRLSNLARCAPSGPPWIWGSTDGEHYKLLLAREQQRRFDQLPATPRQVGRRFEDCLGRRWRLGDGA